MPKMKTNKSAAKRFRKNKKGKVKFKKENLRHMLTGRTRKSKRQKRAPGYVGSANIRAVERLIPYA